MSGPLKRIKIQNHKGIAELEVSPDGKHMTLIGANGAGKSSLLDAADWIVSEDGSDSGMRNGAEMRYGEMLFGDYLITRRQKRGGKPTRNTPAASLVEVRAALARTTFTQLSDKEQIEAVLKLAPGLDCRDIDAKKARLYTERTGIGQVGKSLQGQLDGVKVPEAPGEVGEERDVAAIASRKGEVERVRADNARSRAAAAHAQQIAADSIAAMQRAKAAAEEAERKARVDMESALVAKDAAAALVDPDTSAIDAEIAAAKAHNASVAEARRAIEARAAAERQRASLTAQVEAKRAEYKSHTDGIAALDAEREARIAAATAALPVKGLSISDGAVLFDMGNGPVIAHAHGMSAGECIRLDVQMAAAMGHKLIPIRDASLLDDLADIFAFADKHGVQIIPEVVRKGAPLTVEIADADSDDWK